MESVAPRPARRILVPAILAVLLWVPDAPAGPEGDPPRRPGAPERPGLTDPVVCLSIRGFRDFVPRDEPILSRDEKLQVYYEPFNYLIVRDGEAGPFRAHLSQDVRIRRPGSDRVLQKLAGVIDFSPESKDPPTSTYLMTSLSLKEMPPGPYEIDLVLRDELADGRPETVRTVAFRIVSASEATPDGR